MGCISSLETRERRDVRPPAQGTQLGSGDAGARPWMVPAFFASPAQGLQDRGPRPPVPGTRNPSSPGLPDAPPPRWAGQPWCGSGSGRDRPSYCRSLTLTTEFYVMMAPCVLMQALYMC